MFCLLRIHGAESCVASREYTLFSHPILITSLRLNITSGNKQKKHFRFFKPYLVFLHDIDAAPQMSSEPWKGDIA